MRNFEWQLRLAALVQRCNGRAFEWGVFDCARFASEVVEAVTGVDPWPGLVYASEKEALRHLQKTDLETLAANNLGPEIDPAFAQPGDIGLAMMGGQPMLCAQVGRAWMAPARAGGLAVSPVPSVAWRCVKV